MNFMSFTHQFAHPHHVNHLIQQPCSYLSLATQRIALHKQQLDVFLSQLHNSIQANTTKGSHQEGRTLSLRQNLRNSCTSIPPPTRPDGRLTNTTESTTALNITHMINPKNQPHRRHASSFNRGPPFLFSAASYAWLRKAADGGNGDMGEYLFRYPNFEVKETLGVSSAQKHMEDFVFKNIKEFSPSLTVSSGLIYGSPFCVYRGDPNACHSFATVHVTHEMTNEEVKSRSSNISPRPPLSSSAHLTNVRDPVRMQDLISWCRVARSVNKECIVAFVSSDSAEMDEDGKVKEHDVRTPSPVRFIRFTAIETQLSSVWKHTKYLPS
eukprot:GHVN01102691.1.p1 GENE.GHVN01102691.1~~GHVN01102691.1.p1  ORF type:complete len:325 (-),score=58.19 GHVN01102691.1:283-1257(-)